VSRVHAELRKLLGLPTAWAGLVLGVVLNPLVVLLNASATRRMIASGALTDVADLGLQELAVVVIGPVVLGVVVVSSEYTSTADDAPGARQLTTTLAAVPGRLRLLAAKGIAVVLVVAAQATVATTATLALVQLLYGDQVPAPDLPRAAAAVLYWVLTALLAYAITLIARTGVVPLTLLIVNSTLVSVSYLLTKVTDLAVYLPDLAGTRMFVRGRAFPLELAPVTAGLVMAAWVAALLAAGCILFQRRDA